MDVSKILTELRHPEAPAMRARLAEVDGNASALHVEVVPRVPFRKTADPRFADASRGNLVFFDPRRRRWRAP